VPPVPSPVDDSAPLEVRARTEQLIMLDHLIGRFLRGDVPLYRGTASAHDNTGEIYAGNVDGVIPEGPAVATLVEAPLEESDFTPVRQGVMGRGAFLGLHGIGTDLAVFLIQSDSTPDLTEVSWVNWVNGQHLAGLGCSGCVPSLWDRPAALAFAEIDASNTTSAGHVFVSADLVRTDPCSLSFEELAEISAGTGPIDASFGMTLYKSSGRYRVYPVGGDLDVGVENDVPGAGGNGSCTLQVWYTGEVYVNVDDLSDYGVTNLVLNAPEEACPV
jgi:hypothetical protein